MKKIRSCFCSIYTEAKDEFSNTGFTCVLVVVVVAVAADTTTAVVVVVAAAAVAPEV